MKHCQRRPRRLPLLALTAAGGSALVVAACGGGAFDNAPTVQNPAGSASGQALSFAYFQRCVQPVLNKDLPVRIGSQTSINSCAAGGCHDNTNGTGGALRLTRTAAAVPIALAVPPNGTVANGGQTPAQIRTTEMYRNFYSAQGEAIIGDALGSRLMRKPLVQGVLHGGGLIFDTADTPDAKVIRYWINRPMPAGQDEFSDAATALFAGGDVANGACLTE
jgi:hypothetical protein